MKNRNDGEVVNWLRDMAAIKRREAAKLIEEAEWFERSAAIVAGSPWDTVPMAAGAGAFVPEPEKWFEGRYMLKFADGCAPVDGYAPMDIRPEHIASPSVRKPSARTASRRLIDATREQMRAGATSVPAIAKTVGVSESHIRLAMRALIAAGEVVRTGPRRGPGASYRLATIDRSAETLWRNPEHRKEMVADASPGGSLPQRHATAPAEIPPAAPPVPARDPVVPAADVKPTCERCGGPRHPGSAKLCRKCYRAGVQACAEVAERAAAEPFDHTKVTEQRRARHRAPADKPVDRVDNSPGARVVDMLREAGPAGVPSRALRTESGLEVGMFKSLMQSLLEAHKVEVEPPAKHGGEKIYRLRAENDLPRAATRA